MMGRAQFITIIKKLHYLRPLLSFLIQKIFSHTIADGFLMARLTAPFFMIRKKSLRIHRPFSPFIENGVLHFFLRSPVLYSVILLLSMTPLTLHQLKCLREEK